MADQARPLAGTAPHAQGQQGGIAFDLHRAHPRAGAHGVQVGQSGVDQGRVDPAAGPCPGHRLLQQHKTQAVEVGLQTRSVFSQVVGWLDHLGEGVGRLPQPGHLFGPDVGRQTLGVAWLGQLAGHAVKGGTGASMEA